MRRLVLAFVALILPALAPATPSRVAAIDNGLGFVPDDWDAALYYHLIPHFKNHLYVDAQATGQVEAWAFMDLGPLGALSYWWNRPVASQGLIDSTVNLSSIGLNLTPLNSDPAGSNAHDPLERRLAYPQMHASVGWAGEPIEGMPFALCVQYGSQQEERDRDSGEVLTGLLSNAAHLSTSYSQNLTVTAYSNLQKNRSLMVAPTLGLVGESGSIDLKWFMTWNEVENAHDEVLRNASGTDRGTLRQSLRSKAEPTYGAHARIRIAAVDEDLVVFSGGYSRARFDLEHRLEGRFSGGGFTALEQAGYDYMDQDALVEQVDWDFWTAWVKRLSSSTFVLATGAVAQRTWILDRTFGPRGGDTGGADYQDIVPYLERTRWSESIRIPLLAGAEVEVNDWLRVRGMAQQNAWAMGGGHTTTQSFNFFTGTPAPSSLVSDNAVEAGDWELAAGVGLDWEAVRVDFLLNTAWLASTGSLVNPAARTTVAYHF